MTFLSRSNNSTLDGVSEDKVSKELFSVLFPSLKQLSADKSLKINLSGGWELINSASDKENLKTFNYILSLLEKNSKDIRSIEAILILTDNTSFKKMLQQDQNLPERYTKILFTQIQNGFGHVKQDFTTAENVNNMIKLFEKSKNLFGEFRFTSPEKMNLLENKLWMYKELIIVRKFLESSSPTKLKEKTSKTKKIKQE
jgi:hypothetical protein